jgi:hypothetical protein
LLNSKLRHQYKLNVAGIIIQFTGDDNFNLAVSDVHRAFLVNEGEPDFRLRVHYSPLPPLNLKEKLFDSGSMWALYRSNGGYAITFTSDIAGAALYQVALINGGFDTGDLYIKPMPHNREPGELKKPSQAYLSHVIYIIYPLLMMNLLPRGRGVEFHACGINHKGKGIIFTGGSGSGKSTLGRLWQNERDTQVFSDERIIVRRMDGRFWMYGTPWKSDAGISSPGSVPLGNIFFIEHSEKNYALPLQASEAALTLFTRCFPTFWDESGLNYTLELIGQIAEQIPGCKLGFAPDRSILSYIDEIIAGSHRVES